MTNTEELKKGKNLCLKVFARNLSLYFFNPLESVLFTKL